jgi:5-formyltetrahydrofolate cyclo-ligase
MSAVAVKNLTADLVPDAASRLKGMRMPRPDSPELSPGEIDVVVVPGVAFDRAGGRLGRGMGYYDRFLAGLEREGGGRPRRVAIVFDGQVLAAGESVPMEAHDERVDVIVTPTEVIAVGA